MKCHRCNSPNVFRSRMSDSILFRLFLVSRVRCRTCGRLSFRLFWMVRPESDTRHTVPSL